MANWEKILGRGNVEDRRAFGPAAIGGISLTGIALLLVFNYLAGGDITDVLTQLQNVSVKQTQNVETSEFKESDAYEEFASTVLGSNNEMWTQSFKEMGKTYVPPKLVLFRTSTESACGGASSQVGPHYCPIDKTIYLDETFFDELTLRLGATGGDVAEAYVISHEVGHHVQNELGVLQKLQSAHENEAPNVNELSIQTELQADCYAGLWANSISDLGVLEVGEINEAMDAAATVGDDRIQKKVTGRVNPESWTHGSSQQRVEWFEKGYTSDSLVACNVM